MSSVSKVASAGAKTAKRVSAAKRKVPKRKNSVTASSASKRTKVTSFFKQDQISLTPFAKKSDDECWRIFIDQKTTAGSVKIKRIASDPVHGKHGSLDIKVNESQRGKHIGRFAIKEALKNTSFSKVVANLRKSNLASKKALEAAGFSEVKHATIKQLCLVFNKKSGKK